MHSYWHSFGREYALYGDVQLSLDIVGRREPRLRGESGDCLTLECQQENNISFPPFSFNSFVLVVSIQTSHDTSSKMAVPRLTANKDVKGFCQQLGFPTRLKELGIHPFLAGIKAYAENHRGTSANFMADGYLRLANAPEELKTQCEEDPQK